jgi:hypothetical protein
MHYVIRVRRQYTAVLLYYPRTKEEELVRLQKRRKDPKILWIPVGTQNIKLRKEQMLKLCKIIQNVLICSVLKCCKNFHYYKFSIRQNLPCTNSFVQSLVRVPSIL